MQTVSALLSDPPAHDAQTFHRVQWPAGRRDYLSRVALGQEQGFSVADVDLAPAFLHAMDGDFDAAQRQTTEALKTHFDKLTRDGEVYISFLYATLVTQRMDLLAALLKDRFAFPGGLETAIEETGHGFAVIEWNLSPLGDHRFVFDAAGLRVENTRHEILSLYWEFPLFVHYAKQAEKEHGRVLFNRGDLSQKPGLSYNDNRPDFFLIPDGGFVSTGGHRHAREAYRREDISWEDRAPVAFWRGSTTGMRPSLREWRALERVRLCEIAVAHKASGIFDVGLSSVVQCPPDQTQEILQSGLVAGPVPWQHWNRYKYQIDVDGNASAWSGLFQRLLTGSPVLKVQSSRALMQWFYADLIPWHNYVPIAPNMSDLVDKVHWLKRNDGFARRLGANGRALAERMTLERELQRSVPVISAAFRYFRDPSAVVPPFGRAAWPNVLPDPPPA
jgi:Glycosyl transferase family 90